MDFVLANFNDFFGLFAALNLAYAGSAKFRIALNDDILRLEVLPKQVSDWILELRGIINLSRNTGTQEDLPSRLIQEETLRYERIAKTELGILINRRKPYGIFKKTYKLMFLVSALYCVFMLLIAGYECKITAAIKPILTLSYLNYFVIGFIFVSGFTLSKLKFLSSFKLIASSIALYGVIILSSYQIGVLRQKTVSYDLSIQVLWSIIIVVLPYLLYFVRAFYYRKNNLKALKKYTEDMKEERNKTYMAINRILLEHRDNPSRSL